MLEIGIPYDKIHDMDERESDYLMATYMALEEHKHKNG